MTPASNLPAGATSAYCAIDFGTSNSAVAVAAADATPRLVTLEGDAVTMPTAVFYDSEDSTRSYGRKAVAAYVDGHPGRLMRSLKSILGSSLIEETTQLGDGLSLRYIDVISGFLRQLKATAEAETDTELRQVVLGRPVYFVDDDARADARAQAALESAARSVGFCDISFQFEPVAAALDFARELTKAQTALIADIGGGTSDFTVIDLQPVRDAGIGHQVLANHGVHIAGTDFDQRVELAAILPALGFRALTPEGREVPSRIYFDLATWHLINSVYAPKRSAELQGMKHFYADAAHHRRLMNTVTRRLGHHLVAQAEAAKIALSSLARTELRLDKVEAGLETWCDQTQLQQALTGQIESIVAAALETVRRAGVGAQAIDVLYFTGGSTGLAILARQLGLAFIGAKPIFGDRFSSVATGLGIEAARRYA